MKPATIVGILLIVVAVIGFALGGISFTHEKKDVDLGPLQVSHKETNTLPISPILSTLALLGGIIVFLSAVHRAVHSRGDLAQVPGNTRVRRRSI